MGQINDLVVNGYYISRDSTGQVGLPSLRRHSLTAGPAITQNEEVIPGVEDMQVQFGIDDTGTGGVATRYSNPAAIGATEQVVAVRIWLLVRAEEQEVGFVDGRTYVYGDRAAASVTSDLNATGAAGKAYQPNDSFRRLLVSRTIQLRNALGT
jgi:type IV pilus assembly protein PilW